MTVQKESFTFENIGKNKGKVIVRENRIFLIPDLEENGPHIFWFWHKKMPPAFYLKDKQRKMSLIFMNLHSLKGVKELEVKLNWIIQYLDAALLEELTHDATNKTKNHINWIHILLDLV